MTNPISRIDRYVFWQLLGVFGFFSLVLVAVYWVNRAVTLLETLLGDGQTVGIFIQMSLLTIPGVVELIVPMAAFGAAAFIANKLSSDSELVVLQATGFSYYRLLRPVAYFGLVVALFTALVTNILIPAAATQLRDVKLEIAQNSTGKYLKEGQFHHPADGVVLYFREISDAGEILDIFIADQRDVNMQQVYTAQRAFVVNDAGDPKLLLIEGVLQRRNLINQIISVSRFSDFTVSLNSILDQKINTRRSALELTTFELIFPTEKLMKEVKRRAPSMQYSGHMRLTWPISAAFTAMIGFSALLLGSFSRHGMWKQIGFGTVLLITMYLVHIVTLSVGPHIKGGWVLAYATPSIGAIITVCVLWFAGRPRRSPAKQSTRKLDLAAR